ncbi:MAG: ParB/RepB/Spo0J family partition protein [Proteobacteria bacterium]|nr:ParB/RepB/Spo0J family partition protein [Pseudomonadota bacterium]MDA1021740.1 ParB/RepB/Spo0J family partition protein [Pseudomonadota bacterium]
MVEGKRKSLGRGLSALLGEETKRSIGVDDLKGSKQVPVEFLHPGRYQPRHSIDEERIEELAQSVRENGIIQPLLVRPHPDEPGVFEIIAGERRWRAAQMAKLHEVPVIIRELNDQEALEIGLVENLQRQDLSPLEEADGYQRLMQEFSHTQDVLSKTVGKSRSHVANMMRLLGLPDAVKKMLDTGALSMGHARALLGAEDPLALSRDVVKKGLNVRQTERLVRKKQRTDETRGKSALTASAKDADTLDLERDLANVLGLKIGIKFKDDGGALTIHYTSLDQLDDVLKRLSAGGMVGGHAKKTPPPAQKKVKAGKAPKKKSPKLTIGMKKASRKK